MLLTTAAPEALSLAPVFCPRLEKGRTGESSVRDEDTMAALCLGVDVSLELPPLDFHVPTQDVHVLSRAGGTKECFSGSRVGSTGKPGASQCQRATSALCSLGGGVREAAEVLAFLVMCLIYLLGIGAGFPEPCSASRLF